MCALCVLAREKYVQAYVDYIFDKSVSGPFDAFAKGFMAVCSGVVLVRRANMSYVLHNIVSVTKSS